MGTFVLHLPQSGGAGGTVYLEQVTFRANCSLVMLMDGRSEDHVWTEYWSPSLQHWVHVDSW